MGSAYRASTDVERNIADANQFNLIFLQVFGGFALIAAGLIVANSVGGQVLAQLRDIGVLKSIGFTPRQVLGALLVQNLGLAAIASVAGAALGTALAPVFLRSTAEVLGVPSTAPLAAGPIVTPIAVVLAVVLLFTLVPAWRAARISPIVALGRTGGDRPAGVSRLGTLGNRIGLPRTLAIGLADLARRKARATFTLFALMLAVITATFTLGIEATFDKTMDNPTVIGGPPFDLAIDRDTLEDAPARDLIAGDADVEEVLPTYWTGARVGRLGFDVAVYDGDLARQAWPIRSGRMPSAPGEVALGMVLRDSLGASLGDRLELQYGDGDAVVASVTVVGTYASTDGEVLATVPGTLQLDEPPSDYLVRLRSGANARTVANRLVAVSGGQLDPEVLAETVQDLRDSWRPLLVGLNAVLFGIAGINLMSNLMLGVRERRRELAVLKTVGFTPRQLVTSVVTGSVATALAATVLGIPLGLLATRVMFDVLSSAAGIGTGVGALPGIRWLVLLLPMAVGTAALASLIPAAGAARLRVAEALRHE